MPRKERRNNNVQKEMAKAGSSAGQTKITDTFFATNSCRRGVHGGNAASNVSMRSPNAKDVDTNGNLNTGDGIANSENNIGLDVARSTCDTSVSIFRNTSRSNVCSCSTPGCSLSRNIKQLRYLRDVTFYNNHQRTTNQCYCMY